MVTVLTGTCAAFECGVVVNVDAHSLHNCVIAKGKRRAGHLPHYLRSLCFVEVRALYYRSQYPAPPLFSVQLWYVFIINCTG